MDRETLRLLKLINLKKKLHYQEIKYSDVKYPYPEKNPHIVFLLDNKYINCTNDLDIFYGKISSENAIYEITLKGCEYLETHSTNAFHFVAPFIISILALLVSLSSLIVTIAVNFF